MDHRIPMEPASASTAEKRLRKQLPPQQAAPVQPVQPQQYAQPQYAPPQYVQPQFSQPVYAPPEPVKKKKKTGLVVILAVLVVLVLAVVAIFVFGGSSGNAEDTAKAYTQAIFDFDYDEAEKYSFIKISDYFEFEEGMDISELKDIFKSVKEESYLDLEDQFGDNAKITVSVSGSEVLEGDDKAMAISSFDIDEYYYKGEIEAVTLVNLLLEVKGDIGEDSDTLDLYVVESDSEWYVLNGLDFITDFLDY